MLNNCGATGFGQKNHSEIIDRLRRSTSAETLSSAKLCLYQTDGIHYCQNNMVNSKPRFYNNGVNYCNYLQSFNSQVYQLPNCSMSHYNQQHIFDNEQLNHSVQSNYCQRRNYIKRSSSADSINRNYNINSKGECVLCVINVHIIHIKCFNPFSIMYFILSSTH